MAFKSKAQQAKFEEMLRDGKISQVTFDEWLAKTDEKTLPEKAKPVYKRGGVIRGVRKTR